MKFTSLFSSSSYRKSTALLCSAVLPALFVQQTVRTMDISHCAPAGDSGEELGISSAQKKQLVQITEGLGQNVRNIVDNSSPEDIAEWDAEKQSCSFCQYFLASPCADLFRKWSRCVDIAKEENLDYVSTCSIYTNALMKCTESEAKYFEALRTVHEQAPSSEASSTEAGEAAGEDSREK